MERIIGRKAEIKELTRCLNSNQAEFVAIYGRRRVGKTFLVRELLAEKMVFYHTGLSPFELKDEVLINSQLTNFYSSLIKYGYQGTEKPKDWLEAFDMLINLLETKSKDEKLVIFIDEIAWMDTPRSGFLTAFEHFWNGWAAGQHQLMLVTCSSAASWVLDNIINNQGGLYDRTTCEIHLAPFTLKECEEYLTSKNIHLDRYSQALSYMTIGGIPYYISMLKAGESIAANIDSLFFAKRAKLRNEFNNLFESQFADSKALKVIIKLLAKKKEGFTRKEISELCKIKTGGGLTKLLKSLEESDFIMPDLSYKGSKRNMKFKLIDPFLLFYLQFEGITTNERYWQENQNSAKLNTWRGFAFENLCFCHIPQIKRALGILGVQAEVLPWHSEQKEGGAQTDMIIDRADRLINICEMKFYNTDFAVDKNYDANLRNKLATFMEETKVKKSPIMTLITTYGLKYNEYSGRFQSIITLDDLF